MISNIDLKRLIGTGIGGKQMLKINIKRGLQTLGILVLIEKSQPSSISLMNVILAYKKDFGSGI